MRISILPKSPLGKWSVGLAPAAILFVVLGGVVVSGFLHAYAGQPGRFQWLAIMVAAAMVISGIAAFVTGLISIIKSKERSILVFLAVVIGFFFFIGLFFEISEIVSR